jgi:hypothetical protein
MAAPLILMGLRLLQGFAVGKAVACALTVYSHRTGKTGGAATMDKLVQEAVMEYAKEFVTDYGKEFVEGREHTTAEILLRIWSQPNNELEVGRFLKMLKQGRQRYENL